MVTMKDVAKKAGVSMITVSRVLNSPELVKETTRIKIEQVMRDLEFVPNHAAKALAENNTRAIHLYVPRNIGVSDPFIMHLLAGISEELSEAYYLFLIRRDLEFNQRCDGVIIMGLNINEEKIIKDKLNVPFVLFGQSELEVDCIDIDNVMGAYMMTEYLLNSGHKKIGFLAIKNRQRFAYERLEGYKKALQAYHIPYDESLIRYVETVEKEGYEKSLELLEDQRPTAIFCSNDLLAVGTFRAAEKKHLKVPENISICGFDGLMYDLISEKPLTTIRQPVYEAGRKLASRLLERLKQPDMPCKKTLITPELVVRRSSRCLR